MLSNPIKHRSIPSELLSEISSTGASESFGTNRKPRIETELHWHCVNNQTATYGVKTYNWSDTSKR